MARYLMGNRSLWFILIFGLLMNSQINAQEETEIYRWVDEQGNVHYSDLPANEDAELITVKKGSSASAVKSDVEFPELPEKNTVSKTSNSKQNISRDDGQAYQADASSCEYLQNEMKKSQKLMKSNNELKAKNAANHVESLKIMLSQGQCK